MPRHVTSVQGCGQYLHQLYKTLAIRPATSWPWLQSKCCIQSADCRSESSNTTAARVVHPCGHSPALPNPLPEWNPPLRHLLRTGKAASTGCKLPAKQMMSLSLSSVSTPTPPHTPPCLVPECKSCFHSETVTSVKPVTFCIPSCWEQKLKQILQMLVGLVQSVDISLKTERERMEERKKKGGQWQYSMRQMGWKCLALPWRLPSDLPSKVNQALFKQMVSPSPYSMMSPSNSVPHRHMLGR